MMRNWSTLARKGDRSAFAGLLERHGREVYRLAFRLTHDHDLASDVAQETWIRVWRGLSSFRGDAAFSTWLYRIAVNTASTARRRHARHQQAALADVIEPEDRSNPQPEGRVDQTGAQASARASTRPAPSGLADGGCHERCVRVVALRDQHGPRHLGHSGEGSPSSCPSAPATLSPRGVEMIRCALLSQPPHSRCPGR